jgi:hypothetical protein
MHELQANLLAATAELMSRAGMRRMITRAGTGGENYIDFGVGNGRRRSKTLILPNLARGATVSILGLLESTGAQVTRWLFNGQAGTGTRQILHFGDSGRCVLALSKVAVAAHYRALYTDRYDDIVANEDSATANRIRADIRVAPERSRLIFRDAYDQPEIVELPPESLSLPLFRALRGEVQQLDADGFAHLTPLLDTGRYALEVAQRDDGQYGLGRGFDLPSGRRMAA